MFQSLLMYASIIAVIGMAVYEKGGVLNIWKIAEEHGRISFGK